MNISIVTDEISGDLETAFELAFSWGIHAVELRGYGTNRVPNFSDYQKERLTELLETWPLKIAAVSPGLFKIACPPKRCSSFPVAAIDEGMFSDWHEAQSKLDYQLQETLPAALEFAVKVHAPTVGIFSFERISGLSEPPDDVLRVLETAANTAAQQNLVLTIETEAGHWADTGKHAAELIRLINNPALAINWDPGNSAEAGDVPFPDGYSYVRPYIRHVHFKDVVHDEKGNCHYAVNGEIQWDQQIKALLLDGYKGYISVETHMRPKIASAEKSYKRLKALIESSEEEKIERGSSCDSQLSKQ